MELMQEHPVTSEEKLLRLIRKKNHEGLSAASPPGPGAALKPMTDQAPQPKKAVDSLGAAIRVLAGLSAGMLVFILVKYGTAKPQEIKIAPVVPQAQESPEAVAAAEEPTDLAVQPFESYQRAMEGRDIFQAPWEKPVEDLPAAGGSASELSKQLKLVGILLDKDPKAILEDLATQQTFFLSPGERIGNAVVEEIREDKVILGFGKERVELVP